MSTLQQKTRLAIIILAVGLLLIGNIAPATTGYGLSNIFTIDNRDGSGVRITSLLPTYAGVFPESIDVINTIQATIDWADKTPSRVIFSLNGDQTQVNTNNTTAQVTYNMGEDLEYTSGGTGNELLVWAVAEDGTVSPTVKLYFGGLELPEWAVSYESKKGPINWKFDQTGKLTIYGEAELLKEKPGGTISIPKKIPEVGGEYGVNLNPLTFKWELSAQPRFGDGSGLTGSFGISGEWGAEAKCGSKRKGEVSATLSGAGEFYPAFRIEDISAELAGAFEFKFPRVPLLCQWSGCCHTGYCPYFQASLKPEITGTVAMEEGEPAQFAGLKFKGGELELAMTVAGTVGAGSEGSIYYIAGTIGGRPSVILQFPANTSKYCLNKYIKQVAFDLKASYVIESAWWKVEDEWTFNLYTCPETGAIYAAGCPSGEGKVQLVDRTYLNDADGYCVFSSQVKSTAAAGNIVSAAVRGLPDPILNVGTGPMPSIAANDSDGLLVFVYDDSSKSTGQHQEIYYARWSGSSWTTHDALTNNTNPDIQPVAAIDSAGSEIAVWVSGSEPTGSETGPRDVLPSFEISYSRWNDSAWETPQNITSNSYADMLPWFGSKSDGTLRICWIASPTDAIPVWHDEEIAPLINVMASDWDGSSFSVPYIIASDVVAVSPPVIVQDTTYEYMAYSKDTDGNSGTAEDREVYVRKRTLNGSWETDQVLTCDSLSDTAAQTILGESGVPVLVWVKKMVPVTSSDPNQDSYVDQLWFTQCTGGVWATPAVAFESDGITEPKLFRNSAGKIVLFWVAASSEFSDIYYSIYDSSLSVWGVPQQLTHDEGMETMISLSESGGNILASYVKRRVDLSDPYNPPVIGLSDIYLLEHEPSRDLSVTSDDIEITVTNDISLAKLASFCLQWLQDGCMGEDWCEGADLTQDGQVDMTDFSVLASSDSLLSNEMCIDADVHLSGDFVVTDVKVQFYDGEPTSGGTLIDTCQIAQMLPGQATSVSTTYSITSDGQAHPIYIVVDPNNTIVESDESNNTAYASPFYVNLVSRPAVATGYPTANKIIVGVYVENTGTMDSPAVDCQVRQGSATGSIIFETTLDGISVGETSFTQFEWDVSGESAGIYDLVVIVDPNNYIAESSEGDNQSVGQIRILPDLQVEQWSTAITETMVAATIRNIGAKSSGENIVRAVLDGVILGESIIPSLEPGESVDMSIPLALSVQAGRVDIAVNPDSDGTDEISLTNNTASVILFAPADFEPDGDVDMDDLMVLVEQWLQAPGTPSADIAPEPRDNIVDLQDFERLAQYWMTNI